MRTQPKYLRLHVQSVAVEQPPLNLYPRLAELCVGFEQATGWSLSFESLPAPENPAELPWWCTLADGRRTLGHLRLEAGTEEAATELDAAIALAEEVAALVNEQLQTQHVLWQREAELAAGVPIIARADEPQRIAERLEAILKAGAEALGCQAAAMYLLDAHTTSLKLRSGWGIPQQRLLDPARPLDNATADLEALAGRVVVLERLNASGIWRAPEPFAAAVCVPVSSPTVPLGTLWIFSETSKAFDDRETNLAEVVAGRLAAELERQMLLVESRAAAQLRRQVADARQLQHEGHSRVPPLVDGWELGAWHETAQELGGTFHHWQVTPGGKLVLAMGQAHHADLAGALVGQAVRASLRAHAGYGLPPNAVLQAVNRDLWSEFAGDQVVSLVCAIADPATGLVRYASAGSAELLQLGGGRCDRLDDAQMRLGLEPECRYAERLVGLAPNEALIAHAAERSVLGCPIFAKASAIAERTGNPGFSSASAQQMADELHRALDESSGGEPADAALLVLRRKA